MKKKHVVLAAATLSLALTMGAYKSYADAATKKNAKAATESTLTNTEGATQIAASGDSIVVTGDGAVAENGKVTIRKAGTYLLSGTLEEGQLLVDAEEGAEITLVFDGFKISNSTDAPLLFESGSSITLVLKDGSENAVTDLRSSAEENKAAIYTKSDLTISGNGTLDVTGTAEDAIHSKTNVTVQGGTVNLEAGDDRTAGIRTKRTKSRRIRTTGTRRARTAGVKTASRRMQRTARRGSPRTAGRRTATEIVAGTDGICDGKSRMDKSGKDGV